MNINQEFIPYEQALAMKELGFDEPCLKNWDSGLLMLCNYATHLKAALYQQAFRWFRENYLLFSAINVDQTLEPKFAYCISQYESAQFFEGWNTIVFNSDLYYTYAEAELACLIKLIEIVKN